MRVAVLKGGRSLERNVSLRSGGTGRPRRSISFHTGAKRRSVSDTPSTLASCMTPTAPSSSQARFSSATASLACCQGSEHMKRMRAGKRRCWAAMSSLTALETSRLVRAEPQNTFGLVSVTIATSTRASSIARMRSS
jgi:hypothetical protein